MALAKLCALLTDYPPASAKYNNFQAFIVDHQAREGSGKEAIMVKIRLDQMGTTSMPLLTSSS